MRFFTVKLLSVFIILIIIQSCASVTYVKKHNLNKDIKSMDVCTYFINRIGDSLLLKQKHIEFTKNGRVKLSTTLNTDKDTVQITEKKLFFEKQMVPGLPHYYCKTRWKTNCRERISCYSQKKDKQNEKIMFYANDGRILKHIDNFITFNSYEYTYNKEDKLRCITLKNESGKYIDSIMVKCLKTDKNKNCVTLEHHYTVSDSLIRIYRKIEY
ncbi:hypothetical protein [uncultured Formosa sp.]|uniref:hypothetical protein n=1 Tax=uncultured Formosa sp. TaxID=255435 RepID=UPI002624CF5D|nr:hypothetical protein [uncultured Formosa sp.]